MAIRPLRVLMVAYYYPPRGGGGVQRTVKFAKYLPEEGITPTVLTASVDVSRLRDESFRADLADDVVRVPAVEPRSWRARLTELVTYPDVYRSWIAPAVARGVELGRHVGYDVVYSTASPYSSHVVGMQIATELKLPWVADFRDLWTLNGMYAARTPWQRAVHRRYERMFYAAATHIVAASPLQRRGLLEVFKLPADKVTSITNGFDEADVRPQPARKIEGPARVTYLGSFYASYRPDDFVAALKLLSAAQPDLADRLHFTFVGDHSRTARAALGQPALQKLVTLRDYVPHGELAKIHTESDAFFCHVPARGPWAGATIPQKLFEYLAARKPILAIVPPGDAANIVQRLKAGVVLPAGDIPAIAAGLFDLEHALRGGTLTGTTADLAEFSRRTLTAKLATVLRLVTTERT